MGELEAKHLRSFGARLKGLLGTKAKRAEPVLIEPCAAIHTFGMRYAIDVAFLDKKGRVLCSCRTLPPKSRLKVRGAHAVLERPASPDEWISTGCVLIKKHIDTTKGGVVYVSF